MTDDRRFFLSTLPAGRRERQLALAFVLVSIGIFLAAAPFAKTPLPPVPPFLPIYQSALVINDLITVALLLGQFAILRSRALLVLACGYFFSACMAVSHALSFPGLFSPTGLLGAGPQTTAWLYFFWHGGFPLFIIAYALLKSDGRESGPTGGQTRGSVRKAILFGAAAALAFAGGLTLLATAGQDSLPAIMRGDTDARTKIIVASATWTMILAALAVLWRRRPHLALDLWLLVVMWAWVFDVALAGVLNHGRYDLGWYAGRIYGLVAGSFVLMVLLIENGRLYARLAEAHASERQERQLVREKSAELMAVNKELDASLDEQKRIEARLRAQSEELARKNVDLDEANRAKSDFLANMSHELRTPLNSIIGCSEMLKDGVLGELEAKQRGFVADIFDAGTHLLSLINDILDLSKVEAGMLQLEADAVDVPALLKASTLVVREKALAHRIRLDTRLDPALGIMLTDERKLKQIVYNLLSNAVKFTPEGGAVTLFARRCARAEVALDETQPGRLIALPPGEDGEFLAITVEDSGVGIAEEHLPKLFEPFTQVDSSLARHETGTGLGLSLVRRLAELHGGTVGVASRPGTGSRFSVWLPYREAAAAIQESRTMPESTVPSTPAARAPAAPLALVIEDDDWMAELIEAQLRGEGFEVMRAATAEEGLVRAAKRRPQLITLDIFLPAMDGWQFMRRLKADPKLADTPVVIITASKDRDHGVALGARRVLHKPFVRAELMVALAGMVDARPGRELARVLVVDDNVKAVELLATVLEAEGYRVLRAYGGAEAIEMARRAPPDLVILDLMMPEVSGFEVARALREMEHTARVPILVLTAKDVSAEDHARLKGDVSAILAKANFSASELLAELRRALPQRAGD